MQPTKEAQSIYNLPDFGSTLTTMSSAASSLRVMPVGNNDTKLWGLTMYERTRRLAKANKLGFDPVIAEDGPALLVNCAFAFDPALFRHYAARPGEGLTFDDVPVLVHCRNRAERLAVEAAMGNGEAVSLPLDRFEDGANIVNSELRKLEQPFVMRLRPETVPAAERASYFGAYKGVTDLLTKYLWPEWALLLTRIAARFGISPNMVTSLGAALCIAAMVAFWHGQYWLGMALGLGFMVLDTVDGKLARCTITSSKWGNIFDHGIDLIHPPFWWYAWGVGLAAYGRPLGEGVFTAIMVAVIAGYVLQRLIEGAFMRLYGMHIHVWEKIDSDFRLITARRNPNMVILFVATLAGRPDLGLIALGAWTLISLLFHAVRLAQAMSRVRSGAPITSWLAGA